LAERLILDDISVNVVFNFPNKPRSLKSAFPHVLIQEVRGIDAEPPGLVKGKGEGKPWVSNQLRRDAPQRE
jgi:hypothetical protein